MSLFPGPIGAPPARPQGTLSNIGRYMDGGSYVDLPVAIEHSASLQIGSKLYLLGGALGSSYPALGLDAGTTGAIFEATIDSNGTVSPFAMSAYNLTSVRKGARAERIGGYLYVIGGYTGTGQTTSTPLATMERAPVDTNGISGAFATHDAGLAQGRYNFMTLATNGAIYAIGGGVSSSYHSNTIERAPINLQTGDVGNFVALARVVIDGNNVLNGLNDNRWTHSGIRLGNNVFVMGGESLSTIERIVLPNDGGFDDGDGGLGTFTRAGNLPQARNRLSVIALFGKAYVFGGWNGTFLTSVASAPIDGGELGTFTNDTITLEVGLENGTPLLTNSAVYLFGGTNGTTRPYIQRGLIAP